MTNQIDVSHLMTDQAVKEFADTLPGRKVTTPTISVRQWFSQQGEDFDSLEHVFLNSMCDTMFRGCGDMTISRSNKISANKKKAERFHTLSKAYKEAIQTGEIPSTSEYFPLNLAKENDLAYVRVRLRRALQKQIRNAA